MTYYLVGWMFEANYPNEPIIARVADDLTPEEQVAAAIATHHYGRGAGRDRLNWWVARLAEPRVTVVTPRGTEAVTTVCSRRPDGVMDYLLPKEDGGWITV